MDFNFYFIKLIVLSVSILITQSPQPWFLGFVRYIIHYLEKTSSKTLNNQVEKGY